MRHWLQLVTRSWRTKPARSTLAAFSVALGVAVVVWVTCCYESVRLKMTEVVSEWIGRSHVMIEPKLGLWAVFDEEMEDWIADVPGVEFTTVRTREYVEIAAAVEEQDQGARLENSPGRNPPSTQQGESGEPDFVRVEVTGVVPEKELRFRTHNLSQGRFLEPQDENAIVIEQMLARELGVGEGGEILMRQAEQLEPVYRFRVVGVVDRRRASVNQAPMTWASLGDVQSICRFEKKIKAVDIILSDPTMGRIQAASSQIREIIDAKEAERANAGLEPLAVEIKTTEAQHQKLGAAQGLLRFIMMLLSCAVLLTAFFIILATMSMGVTEQVTELGLLRCVGVTRAQLGGLILLQSAPLGIAGTLVGLPLGLAFQWATMQIAAEYVGAFVVSYWGMALAATGGIGTTLLGAVVPALSAFSVSPAEAARTHSGGRLNRWVWFVAVVGCTLLAAHHLVCRSMTTGEAATFDARAIVTLILLYCGCALIGPAVIVLLGRPVAWAAAFALRLRPQLLGEEIGKTPYRSAAICCGLMVGLSLIVGLVVWGKSVKQGWQFPKEFPDAMLYSYAGLPLDEVRALSDMEGIAQFTVTDDFAFFRRKPRGPAWLQTLSSFDKFSRFLAINPDEGFDLVKLTYIEGDEPEAVAKLKHGGHILITRELSMSQGIHLGDKYRIWVPTGKDTYKKATFTIAGVVASPGLDIAISYFNATNAFQTYAVGAVIGTLDDAERLFGRRYGKLMLFNFDFAASDASRIVSDSSQGIPVTGTTSGGRPTFMAGEGPVPGDGPEERIVNKMLEQLDYPPKAFVTARELKHQIDRNINRVTLLLSAIPFVGLVVAALGLANVMAASVASRSKQIAILRAIGTTQNQVARIVIGEALVLGLIGSAMGLALGIVLGRTSNLMTTVLSGFQPEFSVPWSMVLSGAAAATGLCLISALIPARHASRSDIVSVLSGL